MEHAKWTWYRADPDEWKRFDIGRPHIWCSLMGDSETVLTATLMQDEALIECSPEHAALIATAPDLLKACTRALPWMGKLIADGLHDRAVMPSDAVRTLELLEAAIAKATT